MKSVSVAPHYGIRMSDVQLQHRPVLIARVGEGIKELTPDSQMIQIDSKIPLRNRGIVPDCVLSFDLDHYLLETVRTYRELAVYISQDPKFKKVWDKVQKLVFKVIPTEQVQWEKMLDHTVDSFGAGAIVSQGVLKMLAAMLGRPYDPQRDDPGMFPNLPYRYDKMCWRMLKPGAFYDPEAEGAPVIRVSLLQDLNLTFHEIGAHLVVETGGAFGGSGPAGALVLRNLMSEFGLDVLPFHLVAMAEQFMTGELIHPQTIQRLRSISTLMETAVLYSGLGENGIFWQFVYDRSMHLAELFSNVKRYSEERGAAPVISVIGVPLREDLQLRWLLSRSALAIGRVSIEEARDTILSAVANKLVTLRDTTLNGKGRAVQVWVESPGSIKLSVWDKLMPALAVARANVGTMTLPVPKRKHSREMLDLPIAEVPHMEKILHSSRLRIEEVHAATSQWAITKIEAQLIEQVSHLPLNRAFSDLANSFIKNVREILQGFVGNKTCFPLTEVIYERSRGDVATAIFVYTQMDLNVVDTADRLLLHFADLDLSDRQLEQAKLVANLTARKTEKFGVHEEEIS